MGIYSPHSSCKRLEPIRHSVSIKQQKGQIDTKNNQQTAREDIRIVPHTGKRYPGLDGP